MKSVGVNEEKNKATAERPYTYWTLELYDQENGIRGGGGLGVLAADTRRIAEQVGLPFVLVTPFYPSEIKQGLNSGQVSDSHFAVDWKEFGFSEVGEAFINCDGNRCRVEVIQKVFGATRIVAVTEPGFGELYSGMSGSDHRLYQEVALGFGGYAGLKMLGLKPAVMQLNEVATFFAALARLDELVANGMDFYEAVVYARKHTLYTNHTLVQAAEAEFSYGQFERFVFPNLKSKAVRKWLSDKFEDGRLKLSSVTIEIAGERNGVSKLHARVANYRDIAGERVKFRAVTNGIDMEKWVLPEILEYYRENGFLGKYDLPAENYDLQLFELGAGKIRELKARGREVLNGILSERTDQEGRVLHFGADEILFVFKRRFVDYKRPELPFEDLERLSRILLNCNGHYILSGRVHAGDERMMRRLSGILQRVAENPILKERVHYLPDYDEKLAYGLSVGGNVAINVPVVGLEACGTSWEKDVANLALLISTHDGGVADAGKEAYLNVSGRDREEEVRALYARMEEAARAWKEDDDLEFLVQNQLSAYLPVISGTRMLAEYLGLNF